MAIQHMAPTRSRPLHPDGIAPLDIRLIFVWWFNPRTLSDQDLEISPRRPPVRKDQSTSASCCVRRGVYRAVGIPEVRTVRDPARLRWITYDFSGLVGAATYQSRCRFPSVSNSVAQVTFITIHPPSSLTRIAFIVGKIALGQCDHLLHLVP
jgi:hypothetical protein